MRIKSADFRLFLNWLGLGAGAMFLFWMMNAITSDQDAAFVKDALHIYGYILIFALVFVSTAFYAVYRRLSNEVTLLSGAMSGAKERALNLESYKFGTDAHAIVSVTDPYGTIIYANEQFCEISKYSKEELIGQNHRILNSGLHPPCFFRKIYRSIAQGEIWSGEIRNKAKDGSYYWVATTIMPIRNEDGKLREIISIRTNITSLKSQEHELRSKNQLLDATFENFPGAISAFDQDLRLTIANPAFYSQLGIDRSCFPIGSKYADLIRFNAKRGIYGDVDPEETVKARIESIRTSSRDQFVRNTLDGRVMEIKVWPLDEHGFVIAYIDATDRYRMIEDLKREKEEAEKVSQKLKVAQVDQIKAHEMLLHSINAMSSGFTLWDSDLKLITTNDAFKQFHAPILDIIKPGISLEEVIRAGYDKGMYDLEGEPCDEWVLAYLEDLRTTPNKEDDVRYANGMNFVIARKRLNNGNYIITMTDVTELHQREAELRRTRDALEHIAYFDALTTLPNRAHCQQVLEELIRPVDGIRKRFSIIQIDLDKFKRVNDTLGHATGDQLLKELGSRLAFLSSKVRKFKPYRWGGDEFIAVMTDATPLEVEELCQELTDLISIPLKTDSTTIWPTVSLGVSTYPDDATDLESLMMYSDLALYKTKEMGRDGYQFFSAEMKEKIDNDTRIETDVRSALELDQFELYFQPQISTVDESIVGIEALLRWNHPEKGQLPPGLFLDVVESGGIASALGRAVFDKAMVAAKSWIDEGLDFGRLSINLSPAHFRKKTLIDDFFESIEKHDVNPDLLSVELLESMLIDDASGEIHQLFHRLNKRGIHIELDDFGTGWASLSHLQNLPIDGIKIDRSFVNNIAFSEKQQAIVEVVMNMSRLMKLRVVCEGIETHQQLSTVSQISNCAVQGYLVSRPLDLETVTAWIREGKNVGRLSHIQPRGQDRDGQILPFPRRG